VPGQADEELCRLLDLMPGGTAGGLHRGRGLRHERQQRMSISGGVPLQLRPLIGTSAAI
jgi:hypothetical protein